MKEVQLVSKVLNLIITGIPSILMLAIVNLPVNKDGFKPYYNWNTFNTVGVDAYAVPEL